MRFEHRIFEFVDVRTNTILYFVSDNDNDYEKKYTCQSNQIQNSTSSFFIHARSIHDNNSDKQIAVNEQMTVSCLVTQMF